MQLPACPVPTHATWKSLRDKAGGKPGLSKIDLGKKLDEFHGALKTEDAAKGVAAVKVMDAAAKAYSAEVAKKFPKVAAVVNTEIVGKLKAFEAAINTKAKAREDQLDALSVKMKADLMTIIQTSNKLIAGLTKMATDMEGVLNKFKDGVPADQAPVVRKLVATYETNLQTFVRDGGTLETLAKPLAHSAESVKAKFEAATDTAIDLLAERRQLVARNQKLLARLSDVAGKVKPA